jgi:hypothetical protein
MPGFLSKPPGELLKVLAALPEAHKRKRNRRRTPLSAGQTRKTRPTASPEAQKKRGKI